MKNYFVDTSKQPLPIFPVFKNDFEGWVTEQPERIKNWVVAENFKAKSGTFCVIRNEEGSLERVVLGLDDEDDFWAFAALSEKLPEGDYQIKASFGKDMLQHIFMAWGLGKYEFTRYKKGEDRPARLMLEKNIDHAWLDAHISTISWVRDLINTPTQDMGPEQLADEAKQLAKTFGARVEEIVGDDLLKKNYPAVHAVGRASTRAPRLVDMRWGDPSHPKVSLVGKGVCFDSGGLNLKPPRGMIQMKKDMGGAAHVLGLARMIMTAKLPVCLRVIVPLVENVVSGNAYKPGDVVTTRKGLTVEITNTDAEGRMILSDALAEASSEKPDLLIDIATLTGAARIAVGADIGAMFTDDKALSNELQIIGDQVKDPCWPLPLYPPYIKLLKSDIADIANAGTQPYGSASAAALFLKKFLDDDLQWVHFDIMAWQLGKKPGRPKGGEAQVLRTLFHYLCKRYK